MAINKYYGYIYVRIRFPGVRARWRASSSMDEEEAETANQTPDSAQRRAEGSPLERSGQESAHAGRTKKSGIGNRCRSKNRRCGGQGGSFGTAQPRPSIQSQQSLCQLRVIDPMPPPAHGRWRYITIYIHLFARAVGILATPPKFRHPCVATIAQHRLHQCR